MGGESEEQGREGRACQGLLRVQKEDSEAAEHLPWTENGIQIPSSVYVPLRVHVIIYLYLCPNN